MIAVTPKGRKILDRAYRRYDEVVEQSLGKLDPAARAAFIEALQTLAGTVWASPAHTAPVRRRAPAAAR